MEGKNVNHLPRGTRNEEKKMSNYTEVRFVRISKDTVAVYLRNTGENIGTITKVFHKFVPQNNENTLPEIMVDARDNAAQYLARMVSVK